MISIVCWFSGASWQCAYNEVKVTIVTTCMGFVLYCTLYRTYKGQISPCLHAPFLDVKEVAIDDKSRISKQNFVCFVKIFRKDFLLKIGAL